MLSVEMTGNANIDMLSVEMTGNGNIDIFSVEMTMASVTNTDQVLTG